MAIMNSRHAAGGMAVTGAALFCALVQAACGPSAARPGSGAVEPSAAGGEPTSGGAGAATGGSGAATGNAGGSTAAPNATEGSVTSPAVAAFGVEYTVSAWPFESCDGWGLHVTVVPAIVDGEPHAFVSDRPSAAQPDPTSIRFGGELECCGGKWISFDEPAFSGKKNLVTIKPGDTVSFDRDYPTKGSEHSLVKPGEKLTLTVGIWGTEGKGGELRTSPDLAVVELKVSKEGKPEVTVEPLEPSKSLPLDAFVLTVGSHEVTIVPYSPLEESPAVEKGAQVTVIDLAGTVVRVREDGIVVGDLYFGKLEKGSSVKVDHGAVFVDGVPAQGEAAPKAKLIEFYTNQVSEHSLAGYTVTISPGAKVSALAKEGENVSFDLDHTQVLIVEGRLIVDGIDYGSVKKKAKIGIWFGKVTVDGKDRSPVITGEGKGGNKGKGGKKGMGGVDDDPPPPKPNAITPEVMEVLSH